VGVGLAYNRQPQAFVQPLGGIDLEHLQFQGQIRRIRLVAELAD
jgi:hypothetical protein